MSAQINISASTKDAQASLDALLTATTALKQACTELTAALDNASININIVGPVTRTPDDHLRQATTELLIRSIMKRDLGAA